MYVFLCIFMYVFLCMFMYVSVCMFMYVPSHTCVCVYVFMLFKRRIKGILEHKIYIFGFLPICLSVSQSVSQHVSVSVRASVTLAPKATGSLTILTKCGRIHVCSKHVLACLEVHTGNQPRLQVG